MQQSIKNPNWCRRRTVLKRCFAPVLSFVCIAMHGLMSGSMAEALRHNHQAPVYNQLGCPQDFTQSNFCLSPECIHTASEVLSKMNPEIEPCKNFYQFACGSFINKTKIPKGQLETHTLSILSDKVGEQLNDIIEEERPQMDPQHLKLPNAFYKACMNKDLINVLDSLPMQRYAKSLGGWPVAEGDSWNSDESWTWQDTIKNLRRFGFPINFMVDFSINEDLKNKNKRIITLAQPSLGLDREYLVGGLSDPFVSGYYNYMVDVAALFGVNRKRAEIELKESLEFEIELAKITVPIETIRKSNELYNLRSIKHLQKDYPYVQWLDYINKLLPENHSVNENEIVNLLVPSYFNDLGKLLKRTITRKGKRTIANYLSWRAHEFSVFFLSKGFRKRQHKYLSTLWGEHEKLPRWKECVFLASSSQTNLGIIIGSLYVRKHYDQNSKVIASDMVGNIRSTLSQMIDKVEWMDKVTKQLAKKKLFSITPQIGYPDELLDDNNLKELYPNLVIDSDQFLESALKISVCDTDYIFSQLHKPLNKIEWIRRSRPSVVNAYFSALENSLDLPAAIFQGQLFNSHRPMYMNYGSVGTIIGHEISHVFDDWARRIDNNGKLIESRQLNSQQTYLDEVSCIIKQYGNYTEKQTGLKINGENTKIENICDNVGIKQSYLAYNNWMHQNGEELKLPGLNYTPRQMFWIAAAQAWCAKYSEDYLKIIVTSSEYLPGEFRILGTLRNMEDFSNDFQCPEGASMNPVHKCKVL